MTRLLIYDNGDKLTPTWWFGSLLRADRFDARKGCKSWAEALDWVNSHSRISHLEYWGHGAPGQVILNKEALTERSFVIQKTQKQLEALKQRLTPNALVWFRTCSTFKGTDGHRFATKWAGVDGLNCRIAAHTHAIGLVQSGLRTLKAGGTPDWSVRDGGPSRVWIKGTISCLSGYPG